MVMNSIKSLFLSATLSILLAMKGTTFASMELEHGKESRNHENPYRLTLKIANSPSEPDQNFYTLVEELGKDPRSALNRYKAAKHSNNVKLQDLSQDYKRKIKEAHDNYCDMVQAMSHPLVQCTEEVRKEISMNSRKEAENTKNQEKITKLYIDFLVRMKKITTTETMLDLLLVQQKINQEATLLGLIASDELE
jgi:hypothetical protein